MKKLYLTIIAIVCSVVIIVSLFPVDKRLRYANLENECMNQGVWIYDRFNNNTANTDLVFMGSSHTINGVDDKLITELSGKQAVNFGYCRLGLNLQYVMLKEMLKHNYSKNL